MEWTREAVIGRGSTATVSLATAFRSGELFAVKSTELSRSKFLQTEQSILSKLNSPYLVKCTGFDITREDSQLYYNLFMEYVPRGTLHDEIRRHGGRLEEAMIRRYTWEILQGLDYLHASGVVHCDIKSSNILIGEKNAKISDLGCAKFSEKASKIGDSRKLVFSGTPMFMSPEVVLGQEQGFESDIWALGCTAIEMATGKNPWPDVHDPISALYRIGFSGEFPELPRWLSQKGKDFLEICLRRDPKERMTAKELSKHPFFEDLKISSSSCTCFSPRSVIDQSVWETFEAIESSSDHEEFSSLNYSAASRIESLIGCESNWIWDEDWITVRTNDNEESEELCENDVVSVISADEISVVFGLEMPFLGDHEVELESSIFQNLINVTSNVNVSVCRKRGFVIAFHSVENDVVCRNSKFKAENKNFCSNFHVDLCSNLHYCFFFSFFFLNFFIQLYIFSIYSSILFPKMTNEYWIMIFLRWCEM